MTSNDPTADKDSATDREVQTPLSVEIGDLEDFDVEIIDDDELRVQLRGSATNADVTIGWDTAAPFVDAIWSGFAEDIGPEIVADGGQAIDLGGLGASKQAVLYTLARAGGTAWASQLKNTLKRRYGEPSGSVKQAFEFLERRDLISETGNQYLEYELTDAGAAALRRDAQRRMSAVETIGVNSQETAEVEG